MSSPAQRCGGSPSEHLTELFVDQVLSVGWQRVFLVEGVDFFSKAGDQLGVDFAEGGDGTEEKQAVASILGVLNATVDDAVDDFCGIAEAEGVVGFHGEAADGEGLLQPKRILIDFSVWWPSEDGILLAISPGLLEDEVIEVG